MSPWPLLGSAAVLSLERACYVWIARWPEAFRRWCARPAVARLGEPVTVVRRLFYGFKAIQASVFVSWCVLNGDGHLAPSDAEALALVVGGALMLAGQALNASVFYRLGAVGVFYGDRLGYEVVWCRAFPFSRLSHPQYVGAILTIWGFFVDRVDLDLDLVGDPVQDPLWCRKPCASRPPGQARQKGASRACRRCRQDLPKRVFRVAGGAAILTPVEPPR